MALLSNALITNPFIRTLPEIYPFRNLPLPSCLIRSTPCATFRSKSNTGEGQYCSRWYYLPPPDAVFPQQCSLKARFAVASKEAGLGLKERNV